jgi:hypothetical protein
MTFELKQTNLQKIGLLSDSSGTNDDDDTPLSGLANTGTNKITDEKMKLDDNKVTFLWYSCNWKNWEEGDMRDQEEDVANKKLTTLANYNNKDHTYSDCTYDSCWDGSEEFSNENELTATKFVAIGDNDQPPMLHLQVYVSSGGHSSAG